MKYHWITMLCFSACSLLLTRSAPAQVCGASNASLIGPYGYVANQTGPESTTSSTGTTGTTGTSGTSGTTGTTTTGMSAYSNTDIGQLLGGIAGGNQFALSGILVFDGAGNIEATSSSTTAGAAITRTGTYNVNPDCSISVSLTDAFNTSTTSNGSTTSPAAMQLAGVILGRGEEIDLTSATTLESETRTSTTSSGSTTGTTSTSTSGTPSGSSSSGLVIRLVKVLYQNGCSAANLRGLYGFVLNPISAAPQTSTTGTTGTTTGTGSTGTTPTTSTAPTTVIGYVDFDGNGNIIAMSTNNQLSSPTAPITGASIPTTAPPQPTFSALDFTGTYTVNSDCSGTMTISNSANAATNSTGSTTTSTTTNTGTTTTGTTATGSSPSQSITVDFVITPATMSAQGTAATAYNAAGAPGLTLSFSDSTESGWGYALPQ